MFMFRIFNMNWMRYWHIWKCRQHFDLYSNRFHQYFQKPQIVISHSRETRNLVKKWTKNISQTTMQSHGPLLSSWINWSLKYVLHTVSAGLMKNKNSKINKTICDLIAASVLLNCLQCEMRLSGTAVNRCYHFAVSNILNQKLNIKQIACN